MNLSEGCTAVTCCFRDVNVSASYPLLCKTKDAKLEVSHLTKSNPRAAESNTGMTLIRADISCQFICSYGKVFTYVDVYVHMPSVDRIYI